MLDKENIDHLFAFVKSKYVRYYDLQLELVDHLATSIESEMAIDQSIDFKDALNRVYQRWPITGFNQFIEEKRKGLEKYWRKRFWQYLKRYFQLPKLLLTVILTLFFYFSTQVQFDIFGLHFNLMLLCLFFFGAKAYIESNKPILKYPIYGNNSLLTHEVFLEQIGFFLIIPGCLVYGLMQKPLAISQAISASPYLGVGFSLLLAFTVIVLHAKNTVFSEWIQDEIMEKYPEYFTELTA